MDALTLQEKDRYARQLTLPQWGEGAQLKLKRATVFVAGAGGLGSPVIMYLAAAGVGSLRVCDSSGVEPSNLNRQILYTGSDIGRSKSEAAREAVFRLNPCIAAEALTGPIHAGSVDSLIGGADLILDCLDNFQTRLVLNEYAVRRQIPLIHGGVRGWSGQVSFIHPPHTPCLACLAPGDPPAVEAFPILGATAGIIGSIQALEALKYLSGTGSMLKGRILFWDGERMRFHISRENRNPRCRVCGTLKA